MARRSKTKIKSAKGAPHELPNAELDVLCCVYHAEEITARDIRDAMKKYRPMAHGSVVTLLTRLEAKGLVDKKKGPVGKAFVFFPTKSAGQLFQRIIRNLVERAFGGNAAPLIKMAQGK